MYECCKIVGGTPCGLGVGRCVVHLLVYECCQLVSGTPCGLGIVGDNILTLRVGDQFSV